MIDKRFLFQNKRRNRYFEGWYIRVMDEENHVNTAYIFALTKAQSDPHAFIQVFDGIKKTNRYERFPLEAFHASGEIVSIGENRLSLKGITLKLDNYEVALTFEHHSDLKVASAMGFLAKFPLECYQEVVSKSFVIKGTIKTHQKVIHLDGSGYMEKTYGRRFPKQWFWLQANQFEESCALTLAGGSVPTLVFKPFGFFCLLHVKGKPYVFGTYNRAKIMMSSHDDTVVFHIKRRTIELIIEATIAEPTRLVGPSDGGVMDLDVFETLTSQVTVCLREKDHIIYQGSSTMGGFEWMFETT